MNIILFSFAVIFFVASPPTAEGTSCDVVPFKEWANSPSARHQALPTPVDLVVVTHTVTEECFTDEDCQKIARAIRVAHIDQNFNDIGLSFLVGGNGNIYEGAGWNIGTHSAGYNNRSISISFMGEHTHSAPTKEALKAAEQFLGCFLNTRYLGCEYKLVGHRQIRPTLSPGDALFEVIQTWPHWTKDASTL